MCIPCGWANSIVKWFVMQLSMHYSGCYLCRHLVWNHGTWIPLWWTQGMHAAPHWEKALGAGSDPQHEWNVCVSVLRSSWLDTQPPHLTGYQPAHRPAPHHHGQYQFSFYVYFCALNMCSLYYPPQGFFLVNNVFSGVRGFHKYMDCKVTQSKWYNKTNWLD